MYFVKRLIEPVLEFIHTDNMYSMKPVSASGEAAATSVAVGDDIIGDDLTVRLNLVDSKISHLLGLFQQAKKMPKKPKASVIKPTKSQPTAASPPNPTPSVSLTPSVTVVVQANPDHPPVSVLLYCDALAERGVNVSLFSYVHSTVQKMPEKLQQLLSGISALKNLNKTNSLCVRIVWTRQCPDCVSFADIQSTFLYGESMLLRKLVSLAEPDTSPELNNLLTEIDLGLILSPDSRQEFIDRLKSHPHLTKINRSSPSAVDCFLYAQARSLKILDRLPSNWSKMCMGFKPFSLIK